MTERLVISRCNFIIVNTVFVDNFNKIQHNHNPFWAGYPALFNQGLHPWLCPLQPFGTNGRNSVFFCHQCMFLSKFTMASAVGGVYDTPYCKPYE
ncbi:MAG: hypothetical protein AAB067_02540, partial [Planctomycetota bacterium]